MTPFEERLRQAMVRREPSKDFAARVLEKSSNQQHSRTNLARFWLGLLRFRRLIPVVAALLLMTGDVVYQHQHAVRGEQAKEKLLVAMKIAGVKLKIAQEHVIGYETRGEVER